MTRRRNPRPARPRFASLLTRYEQAAVSGPSQPSDDGPFWLATTWAAASGSAILLDARGTQSGKAVLLKRAFPSAVLFLGKLIAPQRLFERYAATSHCSDHRSFAAHHPAPCVWRRQIVTHRGNPERRCLLITNHSAPPGLWRPKTTARPQKYSVRARDRVSRHSAQAPRGRQREHSLGSGARRRSGNELFPCCE